MSSPPPAAPAGGPPSASPMRASAVASLLIAGVVLTAATIVFGLTRPETALAAPFGLPDVVETAGFFFFVSLGGLLLLRRPGHPIGWLCALLGVALLIESASGEYALAGRSFGSLPGQTIAVWVSAWAFAPALTAFVEILLLFPSGRSSSRLGTWLARAVAVLGAVVTAGWAVASWPAPHDPLDTISLPDRGWPTVLPQLATLLVLCLIAAAGSLVLRYRRGEAVEQRQLKWLAVAAFVLGAAALLGVIGELILGGSSPVVELVGAISIAGVPVAITVAILRYRLYEIDRMFSRTVSYTLLTGLLAAVYAGVIVLVSALSAPISTDSDIAVAASTLAVAGLFGPLRQRVQGAVDRRFNRSAYDAARTAAAFRARLRLVTDVDELAADLLVAVERTVEPSQMMLWLRDSPSRSLPFRPFPRR